MHMYCVLHSLLVGSSFDKRLEFVIEWGYCIYHLVIDYYGSFRKMEVLHSWSIHLHGQMQYFMSGPMMQYLMYIGGPYIMYVVENGEDFNAKQREVK